MTINSRQSLGCYSGTYVRLLFDYLQTRGLDPMQVLGELPPAASEDDLVRYPAERWRTMLERAARVLREPLLGLSVGSMISPAHLGVMGYVLLSSPHLGGALQRMQQYEMLISDVATLKARIEQNSMVLEWDGAVAPMGPLVDETAVSAFIHFTRNITGTSYSPEEVSFVNPRPKSIEAYETFFGCTVKFEQPITQIRGPLTFLSLPLRQADPTLLEMMERQATKLLSTLPDAHDIVHAVRACIAKLAREGEVNIERVASELGTSSRTLHRRLAEKSYTFQMLRDETRRRLAENYLKDPRLTLSEVAWLLGYSELSVLTRAFKRWSGETPSAWRVKLLVG